MTRHIASAALLLLAIQMSFAAQSPPGWNFALFTETPATIEDAWLPSEKDGGGTKALTTGGETEVTDEIQALAAALQNDPVRIYEYVRDHISYEPTYGQRKGAQGTLLSGRGNDLDQSALLVALLNAADPSSDAQFVKAQVDYTQAFLGNLCDTPAAKARLTLYNLGIPASAAGSNVRVVHFWVEATVDSQTRVLDPAFVECERVTGATLSSLLGYDRNTFIDNATNGATIGTDYIEDINYANITNDLLSFTTNALAEIQEDYATATVGEFLGEARNTESPVTSLPTSLPHAVQIVGGTRVEYTEIPDSLHAKVTINHRGIVRTLKAYEIAAKRITITYVGGSKYATLMIDGDTDTTGASTTQGQKYDCTLTLTTPYQSGTLSGAHTHSLTSGESYAVLAEFGVATPSVLQRFREQISRARADGASDTSEAVLCGALNLLGHTYAQQLRLAASVAGKSIGALGDYLLCGGIVRQEDGYGIDLAIQYYRGYYLTGTSAEVLSAYRTAGLMGSAFEHAVFEQAQGSDKPAASTVKLLWKGNGDGHRTYLADSANWSTVQGQLQGYDAPTISAIGGWISSGFKVMLPRRGDLAIGDWEGAGYLAYYAGSSFSTAYVISGDLNGGAGGYLGDLDINTVLEGLDLTIYDSSFDYNPTFGADPVDLFTGDLAHSKRFLALGSEPPRGLGLSGLYNSGQSDQESTLGYGWRHSLDIAATRISHPEPSAGLRQPADLVPLIVRCVVVGDLLKNECNLKGWLISSLVTKWQADQMTDNAVAVRMGNRTLEYVRMPDGSYNPPPGVTATLSLAQPMQWGANGDIPVPADYDGDGIVDAAVFRPSTGHWIIRRSSDGGVTDTGYGSAGDLPAPADYDGDGVVDIAVFRPSNQTWYRWGSSTGGYAPYVWGLLSSDLPVPADYDGDGYADVAVYQTNGTWHLAQTSAGYAGLALGGEIGDKPVPADYDGDGHLDMAIYQANATWHISRSSQGYVGFVWQQAGDLPVPADYDGDGVADAAVYRPATGLLYVHGVDASVATQYLGAAYSQAFAGDFDGDGIAQVGSLNTDTFDWYISGICDGLYRLNKRYGMEYRFNTDGHLGSIVDADGKTLSLSYNAQTNLQTVTDAYSRTLTFSYSGDKVSSVSDSTGRSVSFGYTDSDLTSFTDPDSKIWTYQYDDDHRIVATLDPLSQVTVSNIYNAVGQVVTQYNGHGEMWTFHVSGPWGVEVDPEGGQTTHYFDALGQNLGTEDALGNRAYNYYNGQGLLVSNVDARGYATLYQYDSQHNLANRTDALGNTHAFTYDSDNRLASETDPLGHTTTYGYDSAHHITNMVNALTNETLRTYYTSGSHEGLLHTVTDPEGNVTTYTYGTYEKPYTVTRTDGGTVSNTWSARGDLLTRADANGNETTFTYNNRRLLTSFTDPLENTTSNVYNDAGLKTTVIDPLEGETVTAWTPTYKVDSVTYPDGSAVSNVYNSRDWLVAVVDPRGNVSSNVYDAVGRQIAVVDPNGARTDFALDANGNVTARTNALGKVTSFVYDKLNRLVLSTDPLTHSVSNTWDAASRLTAVTDELGYTTELQYDARGLRTHRIKPDGVTESWEYDDNGALAVYRNGLAQPFTFHRDGQGRVTNAVDAVGNSRSFIFDPVGNLKTRIDADASEIDFTYDDADRLTLIEYPNATSVSFGYNALGLRTNIADWTGSVAYQYDAMHRLTNALVVSYGVTSTVAYAYDSNGNRTETTLAGKMSVDYGFDPANRLTNTAFSVLSSPVRQIAYLRDSLGFATNAVYPNGATATWTRDDASRLTGLLHHNGTSNFVDRAYTLDAHGNVTAMEINAGLLPQVTAQIKRLKQNAADELTTIQTKTNPGVQNWTDKTPVHDDEGNLTSDGDTTYGYDYENRLVSAVTATATVTHAYSGDGNRVLDQTVTSGNTNLHYYVVDLADPLKRPLAILDADGDLVRAFVWGRGAVAQVEADGSVYYFHQDGQGSTLALSDTNAVVTDQWFYSPYGQVMNRTGSTATPYQWIGGAGAFAESYGLYHMRARHYHPALHRFMSRDPLGIAGGGNLYAYAALNPLLFYDPYGLSPSTWDNIINGAVYGDFAADTGWGGVGSQVVIGLMPVVGQIADIRDTIANIVNVWNDPTSGAAWLGLGAAVVAWAPGLDFAKGTFRAGREIATEVGQAAFRNADEVGQAVVRNADNTFRGGRYADLSTDGGSLHRHHMPARQSSTFSVDDGPAIQMRPADHRRTASYGGGPGSSQQAYRETQRNLVDQGRIDDAFLMDVDNIQSQFGNTYDSAIIEAIDAIPE